MATGRIGVTPTLGVRWSKTPAGGTTSLSGLDDNSVSLVYSVGYEQVYRNGVLLSRTNDYTATDGTSITLIDATITGDIIEVFANELVPLTDAISKGQFTAKGALLSATAASTPGVLTVGSNDQVLTADSSTSTGLKWATPSSGGMTLLSTTSLSGSTTTISSISGSYTDLVIYITDYDVSVDGAAAYLRLNGETGNVYSQAATVAGSTTPVLTDKFTLVDSADDTVNDGLFWVQIPYYANTATFKICQMYSIATDNGSAPRLRMHNNFGAVNTTSAISSITIYPSSGNATGTAYIYGVK